jgi:periplasmic protein TonB
MFEQSVLRTIPTRSTPAFFLVTAAELLGITAAIVMPLFFTPPLLESKVPAVLHFARAVALVRTGPVKTPTASKSDVHAFRAPRPLYGPTRIPQTIATMPEKALPIDAAPGITGAFSNPGDGVPGALDSIGSGAPPPPPSAERHAVRPAVPLRVASSVQEAKLINKVIPAYPPLARQTRQFGRVRLVVTIGQDGRVKQIEVLSGPAFLVPAAVEAVKQWLYQPTLLNGRPVEVIAPIDINFILNQ